MSTIHSQYLFLMTEASTVCGSESPYRPPAPNDRGRFALFLRPGDPRLDSRHVRRCSSRLTTTAVQHLIKHACLTLLYRGILHLPALQLIHSVCVAPLLVINHCLPNRTDPSGNSRQGHDSSEPVMSELHRNCRHASYGGRAGRHNGFD